MLLERAMRSNSTRPTPTDGVILGAAVNALLAILVTWAGTDPVYAIGATAVAVTCVVHLTGFVVKDHQARDSNHP